MGRFLLRQEHLRVFAKTFAAVFLHISRQTLITGFYQRNLRFKTIFVPEEYKFRVNVITSANNNKKLKMSESFLHYLVAGLTLLISSTSISTLVQPLSTCPLIITISCGPTVTPFQSSSSISMTTVPLSSLNR